MENPWSPPPEPAGQGQARALPAGASIYAGFVSRCAALLLDTAIWVALIIGLSSIYDRVPMPWGWIVPLWVYSALMESSLLQATLGKRIMGIKVVDAHGRRIRLWRAAGRHFWGRSLPFLLLPYVSNQTDIFGISPYILLFMVFFAGYMMVDWTARRQSLYDKLAGTLVVHAIVPPNQPLLEKRPLFPWYGRVLNTSIASFLTLMICLFFIVANDAEDSAALRARVMYALLSADSIRAEVNDQGCHPGSRPPPNEKIAAIEIADAGAGRCTIIVTLGKFPHRAAALSGGKISLTRKEDGQWTCSSDLPDKYLPVSCRRSFNASAMQSP